MAYTIGTITKGGGKFAHENFITHIQNQLESFGYVTERAVLSGASHELIMRASGYSGEEEFYIGFKTFTDSNTIGSQYFNIGVMVSTGFVSGNAFENQTNGQVKYVRANGNAFDYAISISLQRVAGSFFTKGKYSQPFYLGKFFSYSATYEQPLFVGGNIPRPTHGENISTSISTAENSPFDVYRSNGNTDVAAIFDGSASWIQYRQLDFPMSSQGSTTAYASVAGIFSSQVPFNDFLYMEPMCVAQAKSNNLDPISFYGELEGLYAVPSWNNEAFNAIQVGGSYVANVDGLSVAAAIAAILNVPGARAFVTIQQFPNGTDINYAQPLMVLELD